MDILDEQQQRAQSQKGIRLTTTEVLCAAYLRGVADATSFAIACIDDARRAHAGQLHAQAEERGTRAASLATADAGQTCGTAQAVRYVLCERYDQPVASDDEWFHDADHVWYRRVDGRDFATAQQAEQALKERGLRLAMVQPWPLAGTDHG